MSFWHILFKVKLAFFSSILDWSVRAFESLHNSVSVVAKNLLREMNVKLNLKATFRHLRYGKQTCLSIDDKIIDSCIRHTLSINHKHCITGHILIWCSTHSPSIKSLYADANGTESLSKCALMPEDKIITIAAETTTLTLLLECHYQVWLRCTKRLMTETREGKYGLFVVVWAKLDG